MKPNAVDISWLPPGEEWDFRSVPAEECGLACYWEYKRAKSGFKLSPWTAQRALRRDYKAASNMGAIQMRPVNELVEMYLAFAQGDHQTAIKGLLACKAPVIWAGFARYGSERVIKEFEGWAREEFKKYDSGFRGKGAVPPFNCLKWLSAYRLEQARREAGVSFQRAQECIVTYQRRNPEKNHNDVLPKYASHGAWSKAVSGAKALLELSEMALSCKFLLDQEYKPTFHEASA